jgi:hypothetical protein
MSTIVYNDVIFQPSSNSPTKFFSTRWKICLTSSLKDTIRILNIKTESITNTLHNRVPEKLRTTVRMFNRPFKRQGADLDHATLLLTSNYDRIIMYSGNGTTME